MVLKPGKRLIWLSGFSLAAVLMLASTSAAIERRNPEAAFALFPLNANALARLAEVDFREGFNARGTEDPAAGTGGKAMARALVKAHQSLAAQPLNPRSIRTIALSERITGREDGKRQALLMAGDRLSRRDTLTQIYLIEYAARAGEIERAMDHYDTALRRRGAFRDVAGRNLALGLSNPAILKEVSRQLADKPSWSSLLFYYAIRTPEGFDGFLDLHRMTVGDDIIPVETSAAFAGALIGQGRIEDAVEVARIVNDYPALARKRGLSEDGFAAAPQVEGFPNGTWPGLWTAPDHANAFLQPLSEGGALASWSSGANGVIARRLVALKPDTYSVNIALAPAKDKDRVRSRSRTVIDAGLSCADGTVPSRGEANFTVTDDCRYQWLAVSLPETQLRAGDIVIDEITITPVR